VRLLSLSEPPAAQTLMLLLCWPPAPSSSQ
jgi:hypothetical protein